MTEHDDHVPRPEYDAHKRVCEDRWDKIDTKTEKIYDMLQGLRIRYMVLVAVLASAATYFGSNTTALKLLVSNLTWGHFG